MSQFAAVERTLTPSDLSGNTIIIVSTVLVLLALTWGGQRFPWASAQVLVPLIVGSIGVVMFFVAERLWLKGPTVSYSKCIGGRGLTLLFTDTRILLYQQNSAQWLSWHILPRGRLPHRHLLPTRLHPSLKGCVCAPLRD